MKLAPVALLVGAVCLAGCQSRTERPQPTYSITEMHAYPYYTQEGSARREVDLFSPYPMLINEVVEQGDLDIPSTTKITVVEVGVGVDKDVDFSAHPILEFRVTAHDTGRRVAFERINLTHVVLTPEDRHQWVVPFMIYGAICENLDVTARIISGSHSTNAMSTQKIRATCFE